MQTQQQEEMKMEWEVETEHTAAPEIEVEVETEHNTNTSNSNSNNNSYGYGNGRDVKVARAYNKHIFTWVFNFLFGMFGVDRFLRGQTGLGLLKLISCGGFGYWYLIDYVIAIVKTYSGPYKDMSEFLFDENGRYIN